MSVEDPATAEEMPSKEELLDDFEKLLEQRIRMTEQLGATVELRNAYFERLVVLNGGTLTLTFAVIGALSSRLAQNHQSAFGITQLIVACWMFVASILLCVLHNLLSIGVLTNSKLIALFNQYRHSQIKFKNKAALTGLDITDLDSSPRESNKKKSIKIGEGVSRIVGIVAQLLTLTAFILLMLFIQGNIAILLRA